MFLYFVFYKKGTECEEGEKLHGHQAKAYNHVCLPTESRMKLFLHKLFYCQLLSVIKEQGSRMICVCIIFPFCLYVHNFLVFCPFPYILLLCGVFFLVSYYVSTIFFLVAYLHMCVSVHDKDKWRHGEHSNCEMLIPLYLCLLFITLTSTLSVFPTQQQMFQSNTIWTCDLITLCLSSHLY